MIRLNESKSPLTGLRIFTEDAASQKKVFDILFGMAIFRKVCNGNFCNEGYRYAVYAVTDDVLKAKGAAEVIKVLGEVAIGEVTIGHEDEE